MATSQQQPTSAASEKKKKPPTEDEPEPESTDQRLHRLELKLQQVQAENEKLEKRVETLEDELGVGPVRVQVIDASELPATKAKASGKRKAQPKDKSAKPKKRARKTITVVDYSKTRRPVIELGKSQLFIA